MSKHPGPRLWEAFRLFSVVSLWKGNLVHDVQKLHKKYGEIVRIAPDEISVANGQGWRDIYGHRPGHNPFPKNPIWWGGKSSGWPESIITAEDPADHKRMRKILDPAFTMKALSAQEPLIQSYVDLLVGRLQKLSTAKGSNAGAVVAIVKWYNFTPFDIVGDLGFGEPFDCLKNSHYHPWVATVLSHFKSGVLVACTRFYPLVANLLMQC